MNEPPITTPIILCLIAAVCLMIAWKDGPLIPDWLRFLLIAGGFILAFFAAVKTVELLIYSWGYRAAAVIYQISRAKAITPDSEVLRQLGQLQDYQAEIYLKRTSALVGVPGVAGPTMFYDVDGEMIPADFVTEYLEKSQAHLKPVRDYSEGSSGRKWATAITDFYVKRGLARPAIGNQAAQWTYGYAQAVLWFTLPEEETP
jgi:hypothetical protein